MYATSRYAPARNPRSPLTWSLRARSTAITAYTSAPAASFTTPGSRTDSGADRWRKFLSSVSLEAAAFGYDAALRGSMTVRQWHAHARGWANAAIGC
jgi:hypothetical protein